MSVLLFLGRQDHGIVVLGHDLLAAASEVYRHTRVLRVVGVVMQGIAY